MVVVLLQIRKIVSGAHRIRTSISFPETRGEMKKARASNKRAYATSEKPLALSPGKRAIAESKKPAPAVFSGIQDSVTLTIPVPADSGKQASSSTENPSPVAKKKP
jgi:hypothetical protein